MEISRKLQNDGSSSTTGCSPELRKRPGEALPPLPMHPSQHHRGEVTLQVTHTQRSHTPPHSHPRRTPGLPRRPLLGGGLVQGSQRRWSVATPADPAHAPAGASGERVYCAGKLFVFAQGRPGGGEGFMQEPRRRVGEEKPNRPCTRWPHGAAGGLLVSSERDSAIQHRAGHFIPFHTDPSSPSRILVPV